jgi:hypothetical protein
VNFLTIERTFASHRSNRDLHFDSMISATFDSKTWPEGIVQLLDDHHLVVLSDQSKTRSQFGGELAAHLRSQLEADVITLDGAMTPDLASFCRQLETGLRRRHGSNNGQAWWRDIHSVVTLLRDTPAQARRRYLIWSDADVMLEADVELFSRLVNTLLGFAAEREHVNPDRLLLQRVVFLGGAKLGAYAEDTSGQFCSWLLEDEGSPFWETFSIVQRPPVITYRIDG